jgi:hypothetical protein
MEKKSHQGACYCKAVTFEATGSPMFSVYCHCLLCQRLTGGPFVGWVVFAESDFLLKNGEGKLIRIKTPDGLDRLSCGVCGSSVYAAGTFPGIPPFKMATLTLFGHSGKDFDIDLKATGHIFYGSRMMDVVDGLPKWSGFPGSEQLPEM